MRFCWKSLFILLNGLALLSAGQLMAQNGELENEVLPPVLNYSPENELMSLIEAEFNLTHVKRNLPTNARKAAKEYNKIKGSYEELIEEAETEDLESFEQAFNSALRVYAYYASNDFMGNAKARINQLREIIYKLGEWVFLKETDPQKRLYNQILYLSHGLGQPAYLSDSVAKIIEKEKDAPKEFLHPIKLLLYYNLNSTPTTASSAKMVLEKIKGKLTDRQSVIVDLIEIESTITKNEEEQESELDPELRKTLLSISSKAQLIKERGLRWKVNSTILFLWLRTVKSPDWRQAPLVEIAEKSGVVITPVLERIVLEEISSGKLRKGIRTYKALSKSFRRQTVSVALDHRYLALSKQFTEKTGNFEFLDSVYLELVRRYEKTNSRFKKLSRNARQTFFTQYLQFMKELIDKGLDSQSDFKLRNRVITVARKFTGNFAKSRSEIFSIKAQLAQLYQAQNRHKDAVTEYLDLAKDDPLKYLEMATKPQKTLASWPELPPWGKIGRGDRGERIKLASIYESYINAQRQKNGKADWIDLGHLGLLYGVTGQISKAEALWSPEIGKAAPSPHANGATGILLANYFKQKNWTKFIDLTRVAEERKILPTLEKQVLDMKKFYKIALVQRAQDAIKKSNWKSAILDYEEVINRYPKDPNRPVVLFEVARLYIKDNNIEGGMNTVQNLVAEYPNSSQAKKALLEGGQWGAKSNNPKILKQASDFYKTYVESFTNDAGVPTARFERAKILIKLKKFPVASQYLKNHALDRRVAIADRVRAALMHVSIEDRYGERERAIASTVSVIRLVKPSFGQELYVSAHVILARVATEKVNVQEMKSEEKILVPYINRRKDVADVLGYLRLTLANHFEYEVPFPNQATGIDTYRPTVDTIYKSFKVIQASFEKVCLPRENRYCEQAYGRLKQFSQDTIDALGAVELKGRVQPKMQKVLKDYQQNTLKKVVEAKQKFDKLFDKYRIANERKEFNL